MYMYSGTSLLRPPMGLAKAGLNCEVVLILKSDYNNVHWNTVIFGTTKVVLLLGWSLL